jgi:curved DNA-binding protein CbpA
MNVDYLPAYTQKGDLEEMPLPVLIAHLLDEKMTGMLRIESEDTKPWIYFEDGFPAGVHAPQSQDFLGTVLRELNMIDDGAFNESLMEMAKTKQLQGEILVKKGSLEGDQLERALSLQLARKLSRLFALRTGTYEFFEDEELPPPMEPIRVNPYALIYNGIKNAYKADDLKKGLAILIGRSCKVTGKFVERKDLFEFPPEDVADADLLRDYRLPQEFVRNTKSGPTAGMMMLMALMFCGMLELEEADFASPIKGKGAAPKRPAARPAAQAARRPAAGARPGGASPRPTSPGQSAAAQAKSNISPELLKKIDFKFEQVKGGNHWQVLEVEKEADTARIKKSFISLAKVYHPDRVSGAGDEDLAHRMDVIFAAINEAHDTLIDPNRRAEYDKKSESRGKGEQRPEEAKFQFGKAMVFFKKKDYVKAMECARWAVDYDSKNGDYQALKVWLEFLREEEGPIAERRNKCKDALIDIGKAFPDSFLTFKFLAQVSKDLRDDKGYFRALKLAYQCNPHDVDVARELRLLKIRKEKEDKKGWLRKKLQK